MAETQHSKILEDTELNMQEHDLSCKNLEVIKIENIKEEVTDGHSLSSIKASSDVDYIEQMTFRCDVPTNEVGSESIKYAEDVRREEITSDTGMGTKTENENEVAIQEHELGYKQVEFIKCEDNQIEDNRLELDHGEDVNYVNTFTVQYLKENFNSFSYEQRIEVKNAGRPKPELDLVQTTKGKSRDFTRKFKMDVYEKNDWICGCSVTNRLFCFPCLLFCQGAAEQPWSKNGVRDLGHLAEKIRKHENAPAHINAQLELKLLGKIAIRQQLDSAYRQNIQQQNEQVSKNRYVLSKIIDCIKFCGAFELALKDSSSPGIFKGLVNFSSALDTALKDHFENSVVFKGNSKTIQNELLDCMLAVAQDRIKKEIRKAEYVAVIFDDTTDVANQYQITVIFRYILPDGTAVERFWGFINPSGHDAVSLSDCIKTILKQVIDKPEKLISQSYDGASVMSGHHSSVVQTLIKFDYKYAYYIHCYAHQLNLILSQAASQNQEVRVFFSNLSDITNFFSHSPQRVAILYEIVGQRVPCSSATRWNFESNIVSTVYKNRESLIECMEKIELTSRQTVTINQATAICRMLQDPKFVFWLTIFYRILPHADILYNELQKTVTDPLQINTAITCFENSINSEKNNIETTENEISENSTVQTKKRRINENQFIAKTVAAREVCDIIITHVKERFSFTKHLNASILFAADRFPQMEKKFPTEHLKATIEAYPFLDKVRLQTELELIYRRPDFRNISGVVHLLNFIIDNNLQDIFSATFALLQILITIPMTTAEAERSFSTLKRIKTFLRSSMHQERLTALAMLSIEKQFIQDMPDFNEAVINKFAENKNRRTNFTFKQCNTV